MEDIAKQAIHYYETNDQAELLKLANRVWPSDPDAEIPLGAADVFFFARSIAWRNRKNPGAGACDSENREAVVEKELWHARAAAAAMMTGAKHTAARLLLQQAFILMELKAFIEARSVLGEMLRLVGPEHELRPVFMRLHEEKSAYSYLAEGLYGDAATRYQSALEFVDGDPRGALKVEGGLVLSRYLARSSSDHEQRDLLDSMRRIQAEALSAGFEDVAKDASSNLRVMEAGEYGGWCPFELL